MSIEIIHRLEAMPWGPYKEVTTPSGPMRVKAMRPGPEFWQLWKNPKIQEIMMANGYVIRKEKRNGADAYIAYRWVKYLSEKQKERLVGDSRAEDSDAPLLRPPGLEYRAFQRAGIKYSIDRLFGQHGHAKANAVLIGDDMGLGKTVQAIGIMNQDPDLRDIRALIVCPASLKLNWRNEMRKWILGGMGNEAFVVKDKWPGPLSPARFIIVNYDVLHKFEREIRSQAWDYVVMDEAHMIKNEKSRRTAYAIGGAFKMGEVHKIVEPIPTERRVFLTGTPVPNRIEEAWVIIKACDPEGLGANFAHFKKRYAKSNEHLGELQERMRTKFMVRRMKSQVLKELPPKQRQVMTLDPEEYGLDRLFKEEMTIFKEYKELLKGWQIQTELAKASGLNVYRELMKQKKLKLGIQAGMLAKLRKSTAIAKVPGVIDQVKIFCRENKKKVILFAHHIEVLDKLQEAAEEAGLKVVRIDGGTSTTARQQAVEDFQAGKADVFLGGIIPAGVGLTLTAADTVIFAELDWVPGQMTQCEDRAHRMGQTETVWAIHIVMEGSLDEYMAKRLIEKQEIIEKALDNMAPDEELDEDGREDVQEGMMVDEAAASKGVSPKKLAEESEKLTPSMRQATLTALQKILKVENSVDQAILDSMREKQNLSGLEIALTRKIVYRYRRELEPMEAEMLAWPKKEKA